MYQLDNERHAFRSQYTVAIVISLILSLGWLILFALPYYTIKLHYMDPNEIDSGDVDLMRILYGVTNALFIITFVTQ